MAHQGYLPDSIEIVPDSIDPDYDWYDVFGSPDMQYSFHHNPASSTAEPQKVLCSNAQTGHELHDNAAMLLGALSYGSDSYQLSQNTSFGYHTLEVGATNLNTTSSLKSPAPESHRSSTSHIPLGTYEYGEVGSANETVTNGTAETCKKKYTCLGCAVSCRPGERKVKGELVSTHEKLDMKYFEAMEFLYAIRNPGCQYQVEPWEWMTPGNHLRMYDMFKSPQLDSGQTKVLAAFCERLRQNYYRHSRWCAKCDHNMTFSDFPRNVPPISKTYDGIIKEHTTLEGHFDAIEPFIPSQGKYGMGE